MTKGTHSEEIDPLGKPTHGNENPTGTGTHDRNRIQQERELQDNKAKGNEGRQGRLRRKVGSSLKIISATSGPAGPCGRGCSA